VEQEETTDGRKVVGLARYTVFLCLDCKTKVKYPTQTADGKRCKKCGGGLLIPVEDAEKYRKRYPRSKIFEF